MTNGLSHPNHLNESTSIFRGIRSEFSFLFHFLMKFISANRIAPDGTPRFAASHLGLFCLPMSIKRTPGLYGLMPGCTDCFVELVMQRLNLSLEKTFPVAKDKYIHLNDVIGKAMNTGNWNHHKTG